MAAPFPAHSFSFSPVLPATLSTSKSPNILTPALPLHRPTRSNLFLAFRTLYSDQNSRKFFRTALNVADTDQKAINENEDNQAIETKLKSIAVQNNSMKALTQAYREALFNGDEKSICEIEASISNLQKEKNELSIKSTDLISEIASARDMFLRLNADFENLRKRLEKDRHSFITDNHAEVIKRLLPIIDNFERVKQQMKPETEREKKIDTSYQGIYKQFVEVMRSMSVSVVETVGRPFDPSVHEAIAREKSQQFKSGIVIQEIRRGFVISGRVIRPASVKVSSGLGLEKASSDTIRPVPQAEASSNQ
ncbi:hypothetical protein KSP40_PGU007496 [Platanthera guangdongensis]|uniref:GrpE protein homolog n=1 Tax=Platanthera guangdongensis TaxID=2320717 RepID=A0ABR2M3A9_9ASPA